ncbi:hypothetical protein [Nocardia sp. CA-290969]|uniref:hypothetical protein n=1 Tax=Nocardia sp. CA-290969 TaxID=3239986 RepID=UPI003D93932A
MIVRVQSAELSGVQRFVLRLLGDWGRGTERIGGVALLGGALPRPRRRSTTVVDLLVWTPSGCTLVVLADFRSVQHGVLETPPGGRWQVDDRTADLRTGSGTVNPLVRGRRQRAELEAVFHRHGMPEHIDVLVVLIPKTGSRITWSPSPQEAGEETIMVRIGQSASLTEYFEHPPAGAARWRAADIAQAFETLGIPLSTPDAEELAAEGFTVAANGTESGQLPASSAPTGGRSARKTVFPRFAGSGRTSTRQRIGGALALPGTAGSAPAEEFQAEQALSVTGSGSVPSPDDRSAHAGAARPESPERQPSAGTADRQSDAGAGRAGPAVPRRREEPDVATRDSVEVDRSTNDEWNTAAERPAVIGRPDLGRGEKSRPDVEPVPRPGAPDRPEGQDQPPMPDRPAVQSQPTVLDEPVVRGRPGELGQSAVPDRSAGQDQLAEPGRSAAWGRSAGQDRPAVLDQTAVRGRSAGQDRLAEPDTGEVGRSRRPAERSPESPVGFAAPPAAVNRPPRQRGVVEVADRHGHSLRTATSATEGSQGSLSPVAGDPASKREADSPVSAGDSITGGEVAGPGGPAGVPVGSSVSGTPAREPRRSVRTPVGIRREIARLRQVPGRARARAGAARAAADRPRGPERGRPADVGRPAGTNTGGRGARYAIAVGVAGAALAAVTGTVFAASGFARFDVAEYGALCQGEGGTTVAAPYSATGPSPIHLAGELSEFTPAGPAAVWHPVDARSVQLVACVSQVRLGELVRTCQFPPAPGQPVGRTLNLFAMAYRLSVYEARSGNRLAAIDLIGERFAADPAVTDTDVCRAATGAPEDGLPGRRHSRLSQQQVQGALAPFANPEAPQLRAAR